MSSWRSSSASPGDGDVSDWLDVQFLLGSPGTLETVAPGICLHSCDGCWTHGSYLERLRIIKVQGSTIAMGRAQTTRPTKETGGANRHINQTTKPTAFSSA